MTPDKRVEEIVGEFKSKFVDPQYNIIGEIAYYEWSDNDYADDAILWLTTTFTQYHQDLMREVVEELDGLKESRKRCRACGKHTLDKSTGLGKVAFPFQCTACGNYQEETSVVNQALLEAQTIIKSK